MLLRSPVNLHRLLHSFLHLQWMCTIETINVGVLFTVEKGINALEFPPKMPHLQLSLGIIVLIWFTSSCKNREQFPEANGTML